MDDEVQALKDNDTWKMVPLPYNTSIIGVNSVGVESSNFLGILNKTKI